MEFCSDAIMNNTVTRSCNPVITSNVSDRIEDCAKDYNVSWKLNGLLEQENYGYNKVWSNVFSFAVQIQTKETHVLIDNYDIKQYYTPDYKKKCF